MDSEHPVKYGDYVAHEDFPLWPDGKTAFIGKVLEIRGQAVTVEWPSPSGVRSATTHDIRKLWTVRPATRKEVEG